MVPSLAADIAGILERAAKEGHFEVAAIFDGFGDEHARAGDEGALPAAARALFTHDAYRRAALALDEDEPEFAPSTETTGGALVFYGRADRYVVAIAAKGGDPDAFFRAADAAVHRVDAHIEGRRRDRRKRFLGHRLIARVCDKTYVMSAEIRTQLEALCDLLLDLEEAVAGGRRTDFLAHQFKEGLAELVARPKKAGETFRANLEILLDSSSDLGTSEINEERLQALVAGLEVTIEAWPLP